MFTTGALQIETTSHETWKKIYRGAFKLNHLPFTFEAAGLNFSMVPQCDLDPVLIEYISQQSAKSCGFSVGSQFPFNGESNDRVV